MPGPSLVNTFFRSTHVDPCGGPGDDDRPAAVDSKPGWTTADKVGSGNYRTTNDAGPAYSPAGEVLLLVILTRSRLDDWTAPNERPLIGELTAILLPMLL